MRSNHRLIWIAIPFVALLLIPTFVSAEDCHAFNDALVAHWAFDDMTDAIVMDLSGSGYDATRIGAAWQATPRPEVGALVFDGLDDRVIVPDLVTPPPSAIGDLSQGSISIRFRFRATDSGDIIPLFYYGEADTGTEHNSLIVEIGHGGNPANRKLYFTIVNARFCFDSGIQLLPETWYHFVAVVGPDGNTGYLNGAELMSRHYNLGSNANDTDFFNSVSLRELLAIGYGRYGLSDDFYYGPISVSDVRIYNRPLSSDAVRCLYEQVSGR